MKTTYVRLSAICKEIGLARSQAVAMLDKAEIPYRNGPRKQIFLTYRNAERVRAAFARLQEIGPRYGAAEDRSANVYFIQAGDKVKIGISINVKARMTKMQVGSAEKLELLLTLPGGAEHEKRLHTLFASDRLSGEWFSMSAAIRNFITESSHETSHEVDDMADLREAMEITTPYKSATYARQWSED